MGEADELKEFWSTYLNGELWNLLEEKNCEFFQISLTNSKSPLTILLPDKKTLEKLKKLNDDDFNTMFRRFIWLGTYTSLDCLPPHVRFRGRHNGLSLSQVSNNQVSIINSNAVVSPTTVKVPDNDYFSFFDVSDLISDLAIDTVVQHAGAKAPNEQISDNEATTTRTIIKKELIKGSKRFNYSFIYAMAALGFRGVAALDYYIQKSTLYYGPFALLALIIGKPGFSNTRRGFYTWFTAHTSLNTEPYKRLSSVFSKTDGKKFFSKNDIEKAISLKHKVCQPDENGKRKTKFTHSELITIVDSFITETHKSSAKLMFDWLAYTEFKIIEDQVSSPNQDDTCELMVDMFLTELARCENPEEFKTTKFPLEFIHSPFFLYSAQGEADFEEFGCSVEIEKHRSIFKLITEQYYSIVVANEQFGYRIQDVYVKNMKQIVEHCVKSNSTQSKYLVDEDPSRKKILIKMNNDDPGIEIRNVIF
jgi:hypothetical protein